MATNNASVNVVANESESDEKRALSARMLAYRDLVKSEAEFANKSQFGMQLFAMLSVKARREKRNVNEVVNEFDVAFPKAIRGEWDEKLAELNAAVDEANKTGNATLIKFALATREREIKRHDAQKVNQDKQRDARKSRKASDVVTTTLASFDEYGVPIVMVA